MANFRPMIFRFCVALIVVALSGVFSGAFAGVLVVSSYDMPNGAGQASGAGPSGFNYWDGTYNGTGNVHQDSAPLSGGVGALTDGIISTQPFYNVENSAGTGPYVGWIVNPQIEFHLFGTPSISSVIIFVDNSEFDVHTPSGVAINGTPYAFTITNIGATAQELAISGLNLIGPDVQRPSLRRGVSEALAEDELMRHDVQVFEVHGAYCRASSLGPVGAWAWAHRRMGRP